MLLHVTIITCNKLFKIHSLSQILHFKLSNFIMSSQNIQLFHWIHCTFTQMENNRNTNCWYQEWSSPVFYCVSNLWALSFNIVQINSTVCSVLIHKSKNVCIKTSCLYLQCIIIMTYLQVTEKTHGRLTVIIFFYRLLLINRQSKMQFVLNINKFKILFTFYSCPLIKSSLGHMNWKGGKSPSFLYVSA